MLDNAAFKDLIRKLILPAARWEAALRLIAECGFSQRRACGLVMVNSKTVRRRVAPDAPKLRQRLHELVGERRRLGVLLEREGMCLNHKKLYRLYREEGLAHPLAPESPRPRFRHLMIAGL